MKPIYFDLSEVFLASGVKFKYYGIARTVIEIGYELAKLPNEVRFVVFSPAHDAFFEVTPRLGSESPTGILDHNLPASATPLRLRLSFPKKHLLRDAIYPLVQSIVRRKNLKKWATIPDGDARPVDLSGQVLITLARPKIIADYMTVSAAKGIDIRLYPILHDMIPLHGTKDMFASHFLHDNAIVLRNSEKVLANSEFTKREVEEFSKAGYLPPVPEVIATPLCHEFRPTDETVTKRGPDESYLLCLGTQTGRKNLECVVEALLHLHEGGKAVPKLVLAGAHRKRTATYLDQSRFEPIRGQIVDLLNPNQAELRELYLNALAFVIPSKMEGWGLPLAEALWLGTPSLSATAEALKEVGRDLALYFDPEDPKELAALIDQMQSDPAYRAQVQDRIKGAHGSLRTWKDTAQDVLAAVDA